MERKKNKRLIGVIALFLWGVILVWVFRSYLEERNRSILSVLLDLLVVLTFLGICYWIYAGIRARSLGKQIDKAVFQYQLSHDAEAYLAQLEHCGTLPGLERTAFYGIPAKDYLAVLKLRILREMGRMEEAHAVLDAAMAETTCDLTRQALQAEEALLRSQPHPEA